MRTCRSARAPDDMDNDDSSSRPTTPERSPSPGPSSSGYSSTSSKPSAPKKSCAAQATTALQGGHLPPPAGSGVWQGERTVAAAKKKESKQVKPPVKQEAVIQDRRDPNYRARGPDYRFKSRRAATITGLPPQADACSTAPPSDARISTAPPHPLLSGPVSLIPQTSSSSSREASRIEDHQMETTPSAASALPPVEEPLRLLATREVQEQSRAPAPVITSSKSWLPPFQEAVQLPGNTGLTYIEASLDEQAMSRVRRPEQEDSQESLLREQRARLQDLRREEEGRRTEAPGELQAIDWRSDVAQWQANIERRRKEEEEERRRQDAEQDRKRSEEAIKRELDELFRPRSPIWPQNPEAGFDLQHYQLDPRGALREGRLREETEKRKAEERACRRLASRRKQGARPKSRKPPGAAL